MKREGKGKSAKWITSLLQHLRKKKKTESCSTVHATEENLMTGENRKKNESNVCVVFCCVKR